MNRTKLSPFFLLTTALGLATIPYQAMAAYANTEVNGYQVSQHQVLPLNISNTAFSNLPERSQDRIAKIWGITPTGYQQYLYLMHNTPSGKWYKNLNPAEVLLINAKSEGQRMRYAKIVVQNTYNRVQGELEAQRAYNKAWHELYPNLHRINLPHDQSLNASLPPELEEGDSIYFFTSISNDDGNSVLQHLINVIRSHREVQLHIYITGDPSDSAIEKWAQAQKLPKNLYANHMITMKKDDGYFERLTHGNGSVPFTVLNDDGDMKPVDANLLW